MNIIEKLKLIKAIINPPSDMIPIDVFHEVNKQIAKKCGTQISNKEIMNYNREIFQMEKERLYQEQGEVLPVKINYLNESQTTIKNVTTERKFEDNMRMLRAMQSVNDDETPQHTPISNYTFPIEFLSNGLLNILQDKKYCQNGSKLKIGLGYDINNEIVIVDLNGKHMLIGGASNSGKSVCQNVVITNLIANNTPEELQFIMIDLKRGMELLHYKNSPYLKYPIIIDGEEAEKKLIHVVKQLNERGDLIANAGYRNINEYNENTNEKLPRIVIVIDELVELISDNKNCKPLLDSISRLGRASGVHLILATQSPTREMIGNQLDINLSIRIACYVQKWEDSKVILGQAGAETLKGKGDMYLRVDGVKDLTRLQCAYITIEETKRIINHKQSIQHEETIEVLETPQQATTSEIKPIDDRLIDMGCYYIQMGFFSINDLMRRYRPMGMEKAREIRNTFQRLGMISESIPGKHEHDILMTLEEWLKITGGV